MRTWAKWTLGVAAAVVGIAALRVAAAYIRGDAAVVLPPVATHDADAFGDPLPEGAVARIGTIRWRARGPAVWAPDGEHLIVGGWDDELLAMNVRTGLVDWTMPGHAGKLALNIDVHDVPRILQTGELPTVIDSLDAMVPMPDGHRLLTAGRSLRIWNLDARTEIQLIPIHGQAWPVAVSPDGTLAACSWNTFVGVIDLASGARRFRIPTGNYPTSVAFDRDGSHVIAGLPDGRVAIGKLAEEPPMFVKVSEACVKVLLVPGDGRDLWALDVKGELSILSLAAPESSSRRLSLDDAPSSAPVPSGMAASPDGRTVTVWREDAPVRFFDAATATPVSGPTSETGAAAIGWSPDGRRFATVLGEVYRVFGDGEAAPAEAPVSKADPVAFSPDGRSVALGDGRTLRIADSTTGAQRSSVRFDERVMALTWTREGLPVALLPHGRLAAVDAPTGRTLWTRDLFAPDAPGGSTPHMCLGAASACWLGEGGLHVRDFGGSSSTATIVALSVPLRHWEVSDYAISGDARRVAVLQDVASEETPDISYKTLRAWNVGATAPFAEIRLSGHGHLALSADGRFAAMRGEDRIDLCDLDANPPRRTSGTWTTRERDAWRCSGGAPAFSADGTRLAAGDLDGVVHVFAVPSCVEIATLRGHRATVISVAFSPDGTRLVSGSADMTALVWDLTKLPAPPAIPAAK